MHVGRYGADAGDSTLLAPLFAGNPYYIRGYDYNSFETTECRAPVGAGNTSLCPAFDRLLGTKMAVVNAEVRIPLFGPEGLGVFPTSFLPIEVTPFFDGAVSWTGNRSPKLKWASADEARTSLEAIPVFSAGASMRFNLFGLFIGEVFYAVPFQRPDKGGFWGFQLLPGW